jgi:hypothetical protein
MSKNQCHSERTHHDSRDHQAALITADVHIRVGSDCNRSWRPTFMPTYFPVVDWMMSTTTIAWPATLSIPTTTCSVQAC